MKTLLLVPNGLRNDGGIADETNAEGNEMGIENKMSQC